MKDSLIKEEKSITRAEHRMYMLFDKGTFKIRKSVKTEGLISGEGKINGRTVLAVSQDYTVKGGSVTRAQAEEMCSMLAQAQTLGVPFVFMLESAGARIQDGINGLEGYGMLFNLISSASGKIPILALVMGICAGGAAYTAALCDIVIINNETGKLFLTGSKVLKKATGEVSTDVDLGAAHIHTRQSGVAHFGEDSDELCIERAKDILSYLPPNCTEKPPISNFYREVPFGDGVPAEFKKSYDIHSLIDSLADEGTFLEQQMYYASNIVTGWARINGISVGIIANQPKVLCGALDMNAACKASRFINFCDCFNIPLITLVDTPGFFPGKEQEQNGILRHGAKLLAAYSTATVPKITVIIRKAIGGAYIAMNSNGLGADSVLAWDIAKIAVVDDSSGSEILKKTVNVRCESDYALESGGVSQTIQPAETRGKIKKLLDALSNKTFPSTEKKHSNVPQ